MRRTWCGVLGGLALLGGAARAHADADAGPDVDVARCTSLDRAAVARTVGAELANLGPEVRQALVQHVLLVDCPDAVTANLRVEPAVAGVPVTRSIDLTDLPAEFRVRLVALAGAELLEAIAAALPRAPTASPPQPTLDPPAPDAPGEPDDPASMRDRATPLDAAPPEPMPPPAPPPRAATVVDAPGVRVGHPRGALVRLGPHPRAPRRLGVSARLGLRTYRAAAPVMLEGAVEVARGALVLGALAATVDRHVTYGRLQAQMVGASLGVTALCRDGWLEMCAGARGAIGVARVTGTAASIEGLVLAATARTVPYGQASAWAELAHDVGGIAAVLVVEAGYAVGVIAQGGPATDPDAGGTGTAAATDEVALAGLLGTVSVGARW